MSRKHLTVHSGIQSIIEKECVSRNEKLSLGERKHTNQSVTEEAILFWARSLDIIEDGDND